jgi:hypothetical protein
MTKITFTDMQTIAKEVIGLTDATTLVKIKRDINIGASKLLVALGREYNRKSRFTNLIANQQYYQLPEDGQKLKEIIVDTGGWKTPLEQVADERAWRQLNMMTVTGQPSHYFIKGFDEVGLYPIPSATVTNGIELVFSPKHTTMTQDDYSTGTVTVTNGSQDIIGAGTAFTSNMVGQWIEITDGTDGNWYKISAYTSGTEIAIENYYQGETGAGKSFRIGQVIDFPEEHAETPSDYACYRHYLRRGDNARAGDFKALFTNAIDEAKEEYGSTTDSQVISSEPEYRSYNPFRGDPPGSITA